MNYLIRLTAAAIVFSAFWGNAQTLTDYLKTAAENNPELRAAYNEFQSDLQKVDQAKALPDPRLSFSYFVTPMRTLMGIQVAKVSLSQMFPWFGSLKLKGEISAKMAEAKYQSFMKLRNMLFFNVKKAYYGLYDMRRQQDLQKENLKILDMYKNVTANKYANSEGSMTNVLRVDIALEEIKTKIETLGDTERSLQVSFNRLLNRPDEAAVMVDSLSDPLDFEGQYLKSNLASEPSVIALDKKIEAAQLEEKLAHKKGLPDFGVGIDYLFLRPSNVSIIPMANHNRNLMLMPMVSVSLPFFRKKYKAAAKEADFNRQALTAYKENTLNMLATQYETALNNLHKSSRMISLYNRQIKTTQLATELLYTAYSTSGNDFEELLRMQQQLLNYEINKAVALKDYYTALAELDYLTSNNSFLN